MPNDLKELLKQGVTRPSELIDAISENFLVNRDENYAAKAAVSEGYLDPTILNQKKNIIKQSDSVKIKQNLEHETKLAARVLTLITEQPAFNNGQNADLLYSFVKKLYFASIDRIDDNLTETSLTFFKITPEEINAVLSLAKHLIDSQRFDDALEIYNFLAVLDPENYDVCKGIGFLHLQLDQLNDSLNAFWKAVQMDPKCPQAYEGILLILILQKRFDEARELFKSFYKRWSRFHDIDDAIREDLRKFKELKKGVHYAN